MNKAPWNIHTFTKQNLMTSINTNQIMAVPNLRFRIVDLNTMNLLMAHKLMNLITIQDKQMTKDEAEK